MSQPTRIQLEIPDGLMRDLNRLAGNLGADCDHVILTALHRFVDDEDERGELELDPDGRLAALLQAGLDDLDNGRWVTHDEVVAHVNERARRAA